jgi:hypothetical protein
MGFGIVRGNVIVIENADVVGSRRAGVDCEPNLVSDVVENVFIRNSHFVSHLLAFTATGAGIVRNVEISGNTIGGSAVPMVNIAGNSAGPRHGFSIRDNTFSFTTGSAAPGMKLVGDVQADFRHNEAHFTPSRNMTAILVSTGASASIHDNWFQGAAIVAGGDGMFDVGNNSLTNTPPPGF